MSTTVGRSRKKQTEITFRSWGGKRAGAGRKPKGAKAGVPHGRRTPLTGREPVLITMKVQRHVWSLRARRTFLRIVGALGDASERFGMRIVHFSVQRDHAHLIIEADDRRAVARGMKGLCVRVARALNRVMGRTGSVFADRYHERVLKTPRQTRHAVAYVICNARKHGLAPRSPRWVDPCSSGALFDGWSRAVESSSCAALLASGRPAHLAPTRRLAARRRTDRSRALPRQRTERCTLRPHGLEARRRRPALHSGGSDSESAT